MSERNTERISEVIKKCIKSQLVTKPELKKLINNVSVTEYDTTPDLPKVVIVTIDLEILRVLRTNYKEFLKSMKLIYPSKVIITKRPGNIPAKKHNNVVYAREDFVNDLVFPLIVQSKTQEIFARDEVKKFVYYQGGRVPFNQKEISALENVFKQVMCDDYSIRSMPSSH